MKSLISLLMNLSKCMSCYVVLSMTFLHMGTCLCIMLRVIKYVLYVKNTLYINDLYMKGRQFISGISDF